MTHMNGSAMFSALERPDLADRIIFEIKRMISERRLLPGAKLPTERELAEQFGVSRACVREALHSLETLGLLEARVGCGTFVVDNPDAILQHLSWAVSFSDGLEDELTQARKLIEPAIASMAAQNATDDELEALHACLNAMESAADAQEAAARDYDFHVTLARIAHNRVLEEMIVGLQWLLRGMIEKRLQRDCNMEFICLKEHRAIYVAVKCRNGAAAYDELLRSVDERKLFVRESE